MAKTKDRVVSGADVVSDARRYLGVPYVYGGTNRKSGLDCSGLVLVVCQDLGITSCPRTSEEQWGWVDRVGSDQIATGDLVFFVGAELDPSPGHVGIVVSPGQMIDAPYTGTVVSQSHFSNGTGVNRIVGYGRIPGISTSPSANSAAATAAGQSSQSNEAVSALGTVVAWVVILVMFLVILLVLALVATFAFAH